MKKIQIITLGCKVNQYESASFHSSFEELGHHIVSSDKNSDVVVINTCTVTGKAGAQSRQAIRKAVRQSPDARIIITGCHSELAAKELSELKELQGKWVSIISNGDKHLLVDAALSEDNEIQFPVVSIRQRQEISHLPIQNFGRRTRAYLKIQDGCNAFCTYCIVPYTRGKSRSLEVREVIKQAKTFEKQGYKEIVITGIHVGYYGADLSDNTSISNIMEQLCLATPGVRYRLSSIESIEITTSLLNIMHTYSNFMPHLHIPLQSGCDEILLRMNRRYSTGQFAETVSLCAEKVPDLAVGIDILAGFPGESDDHFIRSYEFLESLDFTYLHVFPYSKRPGTPAADYPDQVRKDLKNKRVNLLRELGELKKINFYKRYIGTTKPVLVEGKRDSYGNLKGFTDNYIPVIFAGDDSLKNSVIHVRLESAQGTTIKGSVISE